jgi:hypothetical protein
MADSQIGRLEDVSLHCRQARLGWHAGGLASSITAVLAPGAVGEDEPRYTVATCFDTDRVLRQMCTACHSCSFNPTLGQERPASDPPDCLHKQPHNPSARRQCILRPSGAWRLQTRAVPRRAQLMQRVRHGRGLRLERYGTSACSDDAAALMSSRTACWTQIFAAPDSAKGGC